MNLEGAEEEEIAREVEEDEGVREVEEETDEDVVINSFWLGLFLASAFSSSSTHSCDS